MTLYMIVNALYTGEDVKIIQDHADKTLCF